MSDSIPVPTVLYGCKVYFIAKLSMGEGGCVENEMLA